MILNITKHMCPYPWFPDRQISKPGASLEVPIQQFMCLLARSVVF